MNSSKSPYVFFYVQLQHPWQLFQLYYTLHVRSPRSFFFFCCMVNRHQSFQVMKALPLCTKQLVQEWLRWMMDSLTGAQDQHPESCMWFKFRHLKNPTLVNVRIRLWFGFDAHILLTYASNHFRFLQYLTTFPY